MKKYILGIFSVLLFAFSSYGQVIPKPNPTAVGIGYKRLLADSTIFIPTGNGGPQLKSTNVNKRGAIYADSTNKRLWVFYPADSSWKLPIADTSNLVPYIGALKNTDLGAYGLKTDFIDYSITPVAVDAVGRLKWDAEAGTLTLGLKGGNVNLALGQESVRLVHNNTGSTLTDGQVIYITGSTGELPSVGLASASSEATSSVTYGMVTEPIAHGANGFITTEGIVHGLNTNDFLEGKAIWLSDTAGNFRQYPPAKPSHQVLVGYVVKKAGGNGSIDVKIQNGYELGELHDVSITSVADGDFLRYNSATSLWKNYTGSSLGYVKYADTASMLVPYLRKVDTTAMLSAYYNKTATDSRLALKANDNAVVHLAGVEEITGVKFFNADAVFYKPVTLDSTTIVRGPLVLDWTVTPQTAYAPNYTTLYGVSTGIKYMLPSGATSQFNFNGTTFGFTGFGGTSTATFNYGTSGTRTYTLPNADGTIALTSQIPSLSGYVQGSGTTNYLSKFTGSGTIGNSALQDNGTNVSMNGFLVGYYDNTLKLNTNSTSTGIAFTQSQTLKNEIYSNGNSFYLNSYSGDVIFATQGSTRATLNNAGRFLIAATDDGTNLLQVGGAGRFTGGLTATTGTFSGIINGTTAAFNSITSNYFTANGAGNGVNIIGATGNPAYLATDQAVNNGGKRWRVGHTGAVGGFSSFDIYNQTDNITPLTIASTGAATFSNIVTAQAFSTPSTGGAGSTSWNFYHDQYAAGDFGLWAGSTNRLLVNAAGNVGIGTSNPLNKFVVASGAGYNFEVNPAATTGVIAFDRATSVYTPMAIDASKLMLNANTGNNVLIGTSTDAGQKLQVLDNSTSSGEVARFQRNIDANNEAAYIRIGNANYPAYIGSMLQSYDVAYISMVQDPTQGKGLYVRNIDGSTSIGTTQPSSGGSAASWFTMNGTTASNYSGGTIFAYNGSAKVFEYWQNDNFYVQNGTNGVYLATNGTSWASASDIRLKKINGKIENALEKLMSLNAVKFSWKSDKTNKENFGLIAQEVQTVFPQLIDKNVIRGDESNTEYLGVKYTELVPVLIKAVQELKAEKDALEARLKLIEQKLNIQ